MSSLRALAVEVLVRVERDRAFAAPLLAAREGSLPARDRPLLRTIVRAVLRNRALLDHVVSRSLSRPLDALDPDVRAALRAGAAQLLLLDRIPPHAAVGETVEVVRARSPRAAGLVNAVLRRVAAEGRPPRVVLPPGTDPLVRLALETSHPEWLVRRWVADLGPAAAEAAFRVDDADAPVDVLLDPRGEDVDRVRERLRAEGLEGEPSPWAPLALTLSSAAAGSHPAIASGASRSWTWRRRRCASSSSRRTSSSIWPRPRAGRRGPSSRAGGRAASSPSRGTRRARRLAEGLRAAGRRDDVLVVRADSTRPPLPRSAFRSVLLDAPCSGTGTLRKNPEIRWRLSPDDLPALARAQRALLEAALDLCAPGGSVVYVTCSMEPEENEAVVAAVLAGQRGAGVERPAASSLPAPLLEALRPDGFFRVPPGPSNDGFSAVVLRKDGGSL